MIHWDGFCLLSGQIKVYFYVIVFWFGQYCRYTEEHFRSEIIDEVLISKTFYRKGYLIKTELIHHCVQGRTLFILHFYQWCQGFKGFQRRGPSRPLYKNN